MASYIYFSKLQNVTISWPTGGGTSVNAGAAQGGEISGDMELGSVFGQDSVLLQAQWVNRINFKVRLSYAKFDSTILRELLGTTDANLDVDGNLKTGYTRAYITGASYDHPTFDVKFTAKSEGGTYEFAGLARDVLFDNLTLPFPSEDAVMPSLTGTFKNIVVHSTT